MNEQQLKDFEQEIAEIYEQGKIKGPIHLSGGNERQLLRIFEEIKPQDYVFSTWRNHYHFLLKGVPPAEVRAEILRGNSMGMQFPSHGCYGSAIVGGTAPIAYGVAYALSKHNPQNKRVWCFLGDMAFITGVANECIRLSIGHDLPITWVIENNGKSVGTVTDNTTGEHLPVEKQIRHMRAVLESSGAMNVGLVNYKYELTKPHSGTGVFVSF